MASHSVAFYYGLLAFLTVVFVVFYAIAYSVLKGIAENYRRYYQKADLQWTGPRGARGGGGRWWLLVLLLVGSVTTAWLVLRFVIFHES
jgi:hypothetical protein